MVSNVIDIKALLPGSGKTVTITKLFKRTNLPNSVLLSNANKSVQNCKDLLLSMALTDKEKDQISATTKTMRLFKHNFISIEDHYFTVESKNHFPKNGAYNIFIDEASMISKAEMMDLVNHFPIQNLILDGDSLQFDPIAEEWAAVDSSNKVIVTDEGKELTWEDKGETWSIKDLRTEKYHQVLLNKQMRAVDEDLKVMIEHIKQGKILEALLIDAPSPKYECENLPTDWHVAYTKKRCSQINQMYANDIPYDKQRIIITEQDSKNNIWKSEIYNRQDNAIQKAIRNNIASEKPVSEEEWYKYHTQLAYAVNSHKMQGTTIKEGDIFIHLDDLISSLRNVVDKDGNHLSNQEVAKTLQKHLYVAVSRATSIDQINIWGLPEVLNEEKRKLYGIEDPNVKYRKSVTVVEKCYELIKHGYDFLEETNPKRFEEISSECNEFMDLVSLCEPMIDDTILPEAVQFAADDDKLMDYLTSLIDTRDIPREEWDNYQEWLKAFNTDERRAKIIESNKARKGHKYKYTDEYLLTFKTKKDLIQVTRNQKIINRWKELHSADQ